MKKVQSHVIPAPSPHMVGAPLLGEKAAKTASVLPDGTDGPAEDEDFVEWFLKHEGAK